MRPRQPADQGAANSNHPRDRQRWTALRTFQADKEAAFTPTLGEVKPRDIFWPGRRVIDEMIVTNLGKALARGDSFFHPILVRDEGSGRYRLIHGHHRLEAWKRYRGEETPITVNIYPPHTPDALITMLEFEENLFRKELTAAERTAQEMRWAAAFKKLNGGKPVTPVSGSGEAAESGNLIPISMRARRGRGNKGYGTAGRRQVRHQQARGEPEAELSRGGDRWEIDFDCDTPEELERKAAELERRADKRQHVEPKVDPRRRTRLVIERPTSPAKPEPAEAGSKIEVARKAFDALDSADKPQLLYYACLQIGLDPLMMAPPATFGLADEGPELVSDSPAEAAPATDDAPVAKAEPGDDGADLGAENLQVGDYDGSEDTADGVSEAADQENLGAEGLQDAGVDGSEAADQEPAGATKCAYFYIPSRAETSWRSSTGSSTMASALRTARGTPRLNRAARSRSLSDLASWRSGSVFRARAFS